MKEKINGVPCVTHGKERSAWYRKDRAHLDPLKPARTEAGFAKRIAKEVEAARLPDEIDPATLF